MRKHTLLLASMAVVAAALSSCSGGLGKLSADNFIVTPSPLEAVGSQVPVTINGRFPEKYMKRKALVTVEPQLRYVDAQGQPQVAIGQSTTFQGEKVQGNNQEISYRLGGNYTMRTAFAYVPDMLRSELYLAFRAQVGSKQVSVPAVKVADGVLATSELLGRAVASASGEIATDAYQYAIAQKKEANIRYLIQQANIRTSELKSASVQEFLQVLRDIKADAHGYEIDNVQVSAYASPDGGMELNRKLAEARQQSSEGYVQGQLKSTGLEADVNASYTAEDWDGFQELVSGSNIQDKDVILRVLSMYKDPEQREQQIHNLSVAFQELADEVLPQLRRARLTINYNVIGRSDEEIEAQLKDDASKLSVEELLYAATLTEDKARQERIYQTATNYFPTDYRAFNNLAVLAFGKGDAAKAKTYLEQAARLNSQAAEPKLNEALLALAGHKPDEAESYLAQATTARAYNEVLGNLQVAQGKYPQAIQSLRGVNSNTAALAQILGKDYAASSQTLAQLPETDALANYLRAILSARTNQHSDAVAYLDKALKADASLKTIAAKDLEFVTLFNDRDFQQIVK